MGGELALAEQQQNVERVVDLLGAPPTVAVCTSPGPGPGPGRRAPPARTRCRGPLRCTRKVASRIRLGRETSGSETGTVLSGTNARSGRTVQQHRRVHRGDRFLAGLREAPAPRRADERSSSAATAWSSANFSRLGRALGQIVDRPRRSLPRPGVAFVGDQGEHPDRGPTPWHVACISARIWSVPLTGTTGTRRRKASGCVTARATWYSAGSMIDLEDEARKILAAQPFSNVLGAEVVRVNEEVAEFRIPIREELKQHYGSVHGGAVAAAADIALTFAGACKFKGARPDLRVHDQLPGAGPRRRADRARTGDASRKITGRVPSATCSRARGRNRNVAPLRWETVVLMKP